MGRVTIFDNSVHNFYGCPDALAVRKLSLDIPADDWGIRQNDVISYRDLDIERW